MTASLPTPLGAVYIDDRWGSKNIDSAIRVSFHASAELGLVVHCDYEYDDSSQRRDQIDNARVAAADLAKMHGLSVIDRSGHALPCSCVASAGRPAAHRARQKP